jgi:Protein of unknown function (DUF4197)
MDGFILSRRAAAGLLIAGLPASAFAQGSFLDRALGTLNRNSGGAAKGASLSNGDIGSGLKEALRIASQRTVGRVGKNDGYFADPAIRIPLPEQIEGIAGALRAVGAGGIVDDLQLRMNRAAEQAAPRALNIFVDAATNMTFDDARMILTGPKDSATQYFRRSSSGALTESFRPVVDSSLSGAGAVTALRSVQTRASGIPFLGQMIQGFNLTDFTLGKALDGLFYYLAAEEAEIRANPIARTTNLLRMVFG